MAEEEEGCLLAATINTAVNTEWHGRNKLSVIALNTWETLYTPANFFKPVLDGTETFVEMVLPGYYIKQIWIHNCYNIESEVTNDKRFSVRLYTPNGITRVLDEGELVTTVVPVEMILADHIEVKNGTRIALLDEGSPLKLSSANDEIQIQANSATDGWVISCWVEPLSQNKDEGPITENAYGK